jgi:hypothetical protein
MAMGKNMNDSDSQAAAWSISLETPLPVDGSDATWAVDWGGTWPETSAAWVVD